VPGHRVAHCSNPQSPFKQTGYILKLDPAFKDIEAERLRLREMQWLRRTLAQCQRALQKASDETAEGGT